VLAGATTSAAGLRHTHEATNLKLAATLAAGVTGTTLGRATGATLACGTTRSTLGRGASRTAGAARIGTLAIAATATGRTIAVRPLALGVGAL
jgi:hypothetical protein